MFRRSVMRGFAVSGLLGLLGWLGLPGLPGPLGPLGPLGLMPAAAAATPGYKAYATRQLAVLPAGVKPRPDLEAYLNRLADQARRKSGRGGLKASALMRIPARVQALDMLKGNYVGHHSPSGYRFSRRFEAFTDADRFCCRGENAARDRQRGAVDKAKARRLFRQWLDSAGHKRNLMSRNYQFVSTGAFQRGHHLYAVQVFWGE